MGFERTDVSIFIGMRGCGKSFLARRVQQIYPQRIIIDSLSEYSESDGTVVHDFASYGQFLESKKGTDEPFTLIYQFDPDSSISETEFEHLLRVAYYFGNVLIVIEEIQLYSTPHNLPHYLKQCLLTGRHQGLALMFTSQRPGEIHKTIISQCHHIFVGKIIEGNDLRYISYFLGNHVEKLPGLPERRFIYRDRTGQITEISNDS